MSKKMLIDASHPEETRVVIVDHNRVEELDFESRNKRQLRGNVYLARVTRVEPSLQAAFIEYGGNKHGFLAFSEIHPDYYQIPYEDRMAILEAEEEEHSEESDDDDEPLTDEDETDSDRDENLDPDEEDAADEIDAEVADEQVKVANTRRKRMSRRRYKIQEVIKRGQILLVQAVKEERGNKGAAMTSYLSLAGRYCVLMPNTPRGGGISRKISNGADRKRLKSVMSELDVPQGMGVIVRTAGAKRTKAEIKRDYEYLSRLWGDIRETTLKSIAPALIHEEGNLVKRSIRDLYNKDIDEVLVEGDKAYKTAKSFIKMLMPSHAKFVKQYKDEIPLFLRYGVERQIEDSLSPIVQLKSGGYLVIHPTEALVSVDVNSGRSTKERNVERTALKTNTEAAQELARQMRLRDLAGLIVVDFIDMDEHKNNRAVERKMKEALTQDRARIQTSRISQFGLMEISRQRRRRSLLEGSTTSCPHCGGVGRKRTIESSALAAIRAIEDLAARGEAKRIRLKVSPDVALYLINEKRELLTQVDQSGGVFTEVVPNEDFIRPHYELEIVEKKRRDGPDPLEEIEKEFRRQKQKAQNAAKKTSKKKIQDDSELDAETDSEETEEDTVETEKANSETGRKRRNRRGRRGGRGRGRKPEDVAAEEEKSEDAIAKDQDIESSDNETSQSEEISDTESEKPQKRRGRRKAPSRKDSETPPSEHVEDSDKAEPNETTSKEDETKTKSSRRRKAPAKKSKESPPEADKADISDDKDVSDDNDIDLNANPEKGESKAKGTRRKAPARKPKASTDIKDETEKPKRRRKAPSRKAASDDENIEDTATAKKASASKRTRKAPARKKDEEANSIADEVKSKESPVETSEKVETTTGDAKPKATRTRKAPSRKPAPKKETAEKSASDKAEISTSSKAKASTNKASKAKTEDTKTKTTRRRAAPKKVTVKEDVKAPDPEPEPVKASTSTDTPPSETVENETPKKKKRKWFGLKK